MEKISYENLYKFYVSSGVVLVVAPFFSMFFVLNSNVQLVKQADYEELTELSKILIDFKLRLVTAVQDYCLPAFVLMFILGIYLLCKGLSGWKGNQLELDEQTKLNTMHAQKMLEEGSKEDISRKEELIQNERETASIKTKYYSLKSKYEIKDYWDAQRRFFEKVIFRRLSKDKYIVEFEKRISGTYIDGIAISKDGSMDIIYEFKWWHNYINTDAIDKSALRLKNTVEAYRGLTRRECEGCVVIALPRDYIEEMYDYLIDMLETEVRIEIVAEELLLSPNITVEM